MYYSSFTIDVEDGISISMRDNFKIEMKPTDRVIHNIDIILELCEKHDVKATFFILGEIAETFPLLVKKIDSQGHEIGVHGHYHDQICHLTPEEFRKSLIRAKGLLEDLVGHQIKGFRAPNFSITPQTHWALRIIAECGFNYDSSIVPVRRTPSSGWAGFEKRISKIEIDNNVSLIEIPIPVVNLLGSLWPVCGGGYLRYYPLWVTNLAFSRLERTNPVVVYVHPYELDTFKYPEYFYNARNMASLSKRLPLMLYRLKKESVLAKLDFLLSRYKFVTIEENITILEEENAVPVVNMRSVLTT